MKTKTNDEANNMDDNNASVATKSKKEASPELLFNFGYIKNKAEAGAWRRGYGYLKSKQVKDIGFDENGVVAKVKGNYKDAYTINLKFSPDDVTAKCTCPLKDEWCKHAVAVALECVEQGLWHEYFDLSFEEEVSRVDESKFEGRYEFILDPRNAINSGQQRSTGKNSKGQKNKARKGIGLQIKDRETGNVVKDVAKVLEEAIATEKEQGNSFNDAVKREFNVMQVTLKNGQGKTQTGWFVVPLAEADNLLQALSQVEDLKTKQGNRYEFSSQTLNLLMAVNVSMAGNVLVSLHWIKQEPYDAYPLEEITLFSNSVAWGVHKNKIYPLSNKLGNLPKQLTKNTFTDIRDADGGKFMYEVLPNLRKMVDMDLADIVDQVQLKNKPPTKIIKLQMIDEATMRIQARLEFSYEGEKVPYSNKTPDTPYIMVVKKKEEVIYWIKRDFDQEEKIMDQLQEHGMELMQTNVLQAEGDNAIDFYNNLLLPRLEDSKDPWEAKIPKELKMLKGSDDPLVIRATLDFSQSVDQFILKVDCKVGNIAISLDQVQRQLVQGKKYFLLKKEVGFIEIPIATMLQFGKALQAFDAEDVEQDTYKIMTFKAGLLAELLEMGVEFEFGSKKFKAFWDVISGSEELEELKVSKKVNAELRTYQKQGVNWLWFLYSYGLNGILADDMGLGKTVQTLCMLQQANDKDGQAPSLVVCPSTIVFNWMNEAEKFVPDLKIVNLTGSDRHIGYKQIKDADIVITSYALLRRDIRALKEYQFRYVILDESQYIKNYESQTARSSKELKAEHRLALSGTPIENRLTELWSVFDFLMPGFMYGIDEFKYRYVTPIEERGNRDAESRLKKQVFPFILRRLKQDVAKDLPPKVESVRYCSLTEAQQDLYLDILEKTKEEVYANYADGADKKRNTNSIFAALLRLRQVCCDPRLMGDELSEGLKESGKLDALKELVLEIIDNGGRILLYSQFVEMLKLIRKWLEVEGIQYEYLTGETRDRQGAVNRFNTDDSIPVFLISLKAGGVGLNLTGADYVIHYDPWWNPAAEDQATDRAHRIGQNKTVFVYRLITKGTVEEKIMKLKDRKRDLVDSIIAADRSVGKMLSFEDLKEILSADF